MSLLTSLLLVALCVGVLLQCVQCIPVTQQQTSKNHGYHSVGRVKTQAYGGRGPPATGKSYPGHDDNIAPWGYYLTQPRDEKSHGYRKGLGKGTDPKVHGGNLGATQTDDLEKKSYGGYGHGGHGSYGYGARRASRGLPKGLTGMLAFHGK